MSVSGFDYIERARRNGCRIATATIERDGQQLRTMILTAPGGQVAIGIVTEWDEPLASTTIAHLDRRLGLKSHFFV